MYRKWSEKRFILCALLVNRGLSFVQRESFGANISKFFREIKYKQDVAVMLAKV